jgi:hypothetical protein
MANETALFLLREALHIRQFGERAPGGNENWRDWEQNTEAYLRSLADWHHDEGTPYCKSMPDHIHLPNIANRRTEPMETRTCGHV